VFIAFRIGLLFFITSFAISSWATRMPDVLAQLGVDKATMGLALFGGPVGALFIAPFSGPLMDRLTPGRTGVFGVVLNVSMLIGIAFAQHWLVLAAIVFFAGCGNSLLDIGTNAATQRLEMMHDRRYMAQSHAFWSLGFMAGALAAGVFAQWNVPLSVHLPLVSVAAIASALLTWFLLPDEFYLPVLRANDGEKVPTFVMPHKAIVGVCLMALGVTLAECAIYDWATLFMHEGLASSPFWVSAAYAAFTLTMAGGRLVGDRFRARYAGSSIIRVCSVITGVGLVGFIFSPHVLFSGVSLALMGLGVSLVYPIGIAAAGEKPGNAARNVAATSMLMTAAFLVAPPGIGFVAEHAGLTTAFLMMVPMVVMSLLLAREADPPVRRETAVATARTVAGA
jgi:MFS family permease